MVLQDVRGRYSSEGVFNALNQEGPDGYDTINWIASQPWSDGKVGMIGGRIWASRSGACAAEQSASQSDLPGRSPARMIISIAFIQRAAPPSWVIACYGFRKT